MNLSHIVAASENNVIGNNGDLPWRLKEDMKFFMEKTTGHIIIAGRKTFESFPKKKPLPNRLNIVITRQKDYKPEGVEVCTSLEEAIKLADTKHSEYNDEVFIIGGGEIYKQSIDIVDKIYLTRINKRIEGDTKYPAIDESKFKLTSQSDRTEPISFSFLTYEKKTAHS